MTFGADFLRTPAAEVIGAPAPPWGAHDRVVRCPGGPYLVRGLAEGQLDGFDRHFGEFVGAEDEPAAVVNVLRPAAGTFLPWQDAARQYFLDACYERDVVLVAGVDFLARLELGDASRLTVWTLREPAHGLADMVENGLRILTSYRLLAVGGCLLHGAALVDGGVAHVFVGRSGAGKSTLTLLSRDEGCEVVSDDVAAVLPAGGGFELATTPFAGELRLVGHAGRRYPLETVSRLAKGGGHSWAPVAGAAAVATLAAHASFVNADPHRGIRLLEVVQRVAAVVPVGELTFARRAGVWDVLRAVAMGGPR